jgi:hypothetical protein
MVIKKRLRRPAHHARIFKSRKRYHSLTLAFSNPAQSGEFTNEMLEQNILTSSEPMSYSLGTRMIPSDVCRPDSSLITYTLSRFPFPRHTANMTSISTLYPQSKTYLRSLLHQTLIMTLSLFSRTATQQNVKVPWYHELAVIPHPSQSLYILAIKLKPVLELPSLSVNDSMRASAST